MTANEPRRPSLAGRHSRRWVPAVMGGAMVAALFAFPAAGSDQVAASSPSERSAVWDLGREVETWGPEARVSLGREQLITGITVTWRGDPVDIAAIEVSTTGDDTDRAVVASDVRPEAGPEFTYTFGEEVPAWYVAVVLVEGDAASSLETITVHRRPVDETVLLSEDFEAGTVGNLPEGWVATAAADGTSVQPGPNGSGQSLRYVHDGVTWMRRDFEPVIGGTVNASYRVYAEQTDNIFGAHLGIHEGQNGIGSFSTSLYTWSDGNWRTNVGSPSVTLGPYAAGRWYDVEVTIHHDDGVFDLAIDGELVRTGAAVRNAVADIGAFYLNTFEAGSGQVYYDDIVVTWMQGPDPVFEIPDSDGLQYPSLGTVAPRHANQIDASPWSVGGETLDRDIANYDAYGDYVGPLGVKGIRIQAGWAKTESEPGVYNWEWLDRVVDDLVRQGVRPWVMLGYGNPVYPGGGSASNWQSLPTSDEALRAWDAWVAAAVARYADRVHEWEIWNEPNITPITATMAADFHMRTARTIREHQPDATIIGVATSGVAVSYVDQFLARLDNAGELDLIDEVSFHAYTNNPDSIYPAVDQLRTLVGSYSDHIGLRQGEAGAPVMGGGCGALNDYQWSQVSQAKWNARRMLGDFAHGIPVTSIFHMMDLNYSSGCLVPVGHLDVDLDDMTVRGTRQAYRAVQTVTALFDARWAPATQNPISVDDASRANAVFTYERDDGQMLGLAWYNDATPDNGISKDLVTWTLTGAGIDTPVMVDVRTGRAYGVPSAAIDRRQDGTLTVTAPLADSPVVMMDATLLAEYTCPGTVLVGDVDSAVADRFVAATQNPLLASDACLSALVDDGREWPSRSVFMRHVGTVTESLRNDGVVDDRQRGALMRAAGQSEVGR